MKDNKNWRLFAKKFKDTTECIEEIRDFVSDNINVGVDYADKNNPILKLYDVEENKPFAIGNLGDYVVNKDGKFDIVTSDELIDLMV